MGFADLLTDANAVVADCLGEACTHIGATGAETACTVIITSAAEALALSAGSIVSEQRWSGLADKADLSSRPQEGDRIVTAAGERYAVDDASDESGMWHMSLRLVT